MYKMKPLNKTETREEVLEWMKYKKRILDNDLIWYVEHLHIQVDEINKRGLKKIATFRTGEGYDISEKDFKKVVNQTS